MDERADAGDHEQHRAAQRIEGQAERHGEEGREVEPGNRGRGGSLLEEDEAAANEAPEDGRDGNESAQGAQWAGREEDEERPKRAAGAGRSRAGAKSWRNPPVNDFSCDAGDKFWGAHATRVLVAATRRHGLFPGERRTTNEITISARRKVRAGEVAIASTRVACAPQSSAIARVPHFKISSVLMSSTWVVRRAR